METKKWLVGDLIKSPNLTFAVPIYQRNYSWNQENCQRLFDDLVIAIQADKIHFLGIICCEHENYTVYIVDGQQRVSSLFLLLKAVYDLTKDETLKKYFFDDNGNARLTLSQKDHQIWKDLLGGKEIHEKSLLYEAYLFFRQLVVQYQNSGGCISELLDGIRNHLQLVELMIDKNENPQEIFETLNSTGVALSDTDLLRNYFLMPFDPDQQEKLYKYWREIEVNIPDKEMPSFFADYLIYKRKSPSIMLDDSKKSISVNNLYRIYKSSYHILDYKSVEALFKEMAYCSNLYKKMLFGKEDLLMLQDEAGVQLHLLFKTLLSTAARPLVLYLLIEQKEHRITESELIEALKIIINMNIRSKIAPGRFQGVCKQTAGNMIARLSDSNDAFIDSFWREITNGEGSYRFPDDAEFMKGLTNPGLKKDLAKFLLVCFELHSKYIKEPPDLNNYTLEHIMPQNISKWTNLTSRDNYAQDLNRLGNLALTGFNFDMGNEPFEKKLEFYSESTYRHTRELTNYSDWQHEQIMERTQKLANLALKIFPLPELYVREETGQLHTLNEDFNFFTHRKVKKVIIDGTEKNRNSWAKMLEEISNTAVKKDKLKFTNIVSRNKSLQPKTSDSSRTIKLVNGTEINATLSTVSALKLCKIIADDYNLDVKFLIK